MLNCFKDYKRCIHISYHICDFVQQKKTKFTIEQPYMLPMLCWQYHACWCSGNCISMMTSSHWNIFCITGPLWRETSSPSQRPRNLLDVRNVEFGAFFVVNLYMLLNKQLICLSLEMPWQSCNITVMSLQLLCLYYWKHFKIPPRRPRPAYTHCCKRNSFTSSMLHHWLSSCQWYREHSRTAQQRLAKWLLRLLETCIPWPTKRYGLLTKTEQ